MSVPDFLSSTDYAQICDSLPDPTFILSESGRYIAILGGKDKRYYHDGSSLVGKYLQDVLVPTKTSWFLEQIRKAIDSQQMLVVEYELSSRDVLGLPPEGPEEVIIFEGRISPLKHAVHGEAAVVWVASNMTASKNLQNQLLQRAMSDELTGLCNRRHFMQSLARAYSDFIARKVPSICLLSVDVDHFKAINDQQGHVAGIRRCAIWPRPCCRWRGLRIWCAVWGAMNLPFCAIPPWSRCPRLHSSCWSWAARPCAPMPHAAARLR